MKEVLKNYKERLINLNGRNKSLVLKKIYKKRSFDLMRLLDEDSLLEAPLMSYLLERQKTPFLLIDDPFKLRVKKLKELEKQIEADKKEEMKILKSTVEEMFPLSEEEMQVMIRREEEIDQKYALLIEDEKKQIDKQVEKIIDYFNQFNYLAREIDAVEKETGKYELFIGYPFVEGCFNDGTFVRGPLVLFPVLLSKKNNQWLLTNINDQDILINKVLVYGYAKYNAIKLEDFDTEFATLESFGVNPMDGIIDYVNEHKLITNHPTGLSPEKFKDYTVATTPAYKQGELLIKPYVILGQFPLSSSIYSDYQVLEDEEVVDQELLEALLLNQESIAQIQKMEKEEKNEKDVLSEHDTFFFTQLDYSQENAVSRMGKANKLVIYGPPGTGKSHTIANMITDGLCKDKRILMVSQKRAALDVIYNRLSDIKGKMVLIHDANKDKKEFYKKVSESISEDALSYDLNIKLIRDEMATKIDQKVIGLEKIAHTLMAERKFGLSMQEMYIKTRGIFETTDARFPFYKKFRRNNPFGQYDYKTLSVSVNKMAKDELLISQFATYRGKIDDNPYMLAFSHKMDVMAYEDIVEGTTKLIQWIDGQNDLDLLAYEAFGQFYIQKKGQYGVNGIVEAAKAYNKAVHGGLLDENEGTWLKKLSHLKEIKANKETYMSYEENYVTLFKSYDEWLRDGLSALSGIKEELTPNLYDQLEAALILKFNIKEELNQLVKALDQQEALLPLKTKVQSLDFLDDKILNYIFDETESEAEAKTLLGYLLEFIILEQINTLEKSEDFNEFYLYFNMYVETVDEITGYMEEKNNLTKEIAKSKWNDKFQVFVDTSIYKEFKRQAEKKRQLWPIRKYILEFSEMLLTLFPCWLLSPETVSDIFPLKKGLFDIVIFDEASQIFVENAIPTIYRGKSVVIAGDDQQLQPSSTFMTKYDDFDEEEATLENVAALEEESLLDLAKVNYDSVHLNYHYRSRYEELINFSNYAFYGGTLNISPNIKHTKALDHPPIERIKVDGLWEGRKNSIEANQVVDLVADLLANRKNNETIGIITFNITQKDLIEDLLEARVNYDSTFKEQYMKESSRYDGNEDVSIFVKNIENVQGDERDIIIFSVGYAKNLDGKLSVNFGSLSQDGGENRLNVAISRAKRKVYVVTSIEPEELKVDGTLNRGPKLLRDYLAYSKAVSERDEAGINHSLSQLSEQRRAKSMEEDEFVTAVAKALREKGHEVLINIGSSESKIDLAILHPVTNEFVLGVECDGKTYRSIPSVRERDIHRKRFLESRGWEMTRIWSIDWWKNPTLVIDKIEHLLGVLVDSVEEVSSEAALKMKPVEVLNPEEVYPENVVWFGDQVLVKDNMTKEVFDILMDGNPANQDLMNPFKRQLLGMNNGHIFDYEGFEYQIVGVKKKKLKR